MKCFFRIICCITMFVSCTTTKKETTLTKDYSTIRSFEVTHAVLSSGKLIRVDSFSSKYIPARPVDVWLPSNYSKNKKYAVLYMHDGQNLFDATTTWNKQEWQVDEVIGKLNSKNAIQDVIVVAIHNISEIRFLEYYPKKSLELLPTTVMDSIIADAYKSGYPLAKKDFTGDNYLKFMVEELKPYIDATYSTKAEPENTYIAGSSMGGLISMYAMCEYPHIFGNAACLSTHWLGLVYLPNKPVASISYSILNYLKTNVPSPKTHRFYFDSGTKDVDQYYGQYKSFVDQIFKSKGYSDSNYLNLSFDGEGHSENAWQKRLDIPLEYLLR